MHQITFDFISDSNIELVSYLTGSKQKFAYRSWYTDLLEPVVKNYNGFLSIKPVNIMNRFIAQEYLKTFNITRYSFNTSVEIVWEIHYKYLHNDD